MNQPLPASVSRDNLAAVELPIAEANGMPNATYTDPDWFQFERDHVLGKSWAALGFRDSYNQENTVTPVDFMGLPLMVASDRKGNLRVFHNVCSHRGMHLVTQTKKTNGLVVCPYHSWTYDLNGQLKATPHIGGIGVHKAEGFSCENNGLKPVASHCWMGIVFINLSGDAPAFSQHAAPLIERYKQYIGENGESQLSPPEQDASIRFEVNCNWKLAVENFCEAYHLPWVHPGLNRYSPLSEHYNMTISDDFSGQGCLSFTPTLDGETTLPCFPDWPSDRHKIAEYPAFYPNLLLGFQVDHFYGIIIQPRSIEQTVEEIRMYYVEDGATGEQYGEIRRSNLETWEEVFAEDVWAVEGMQQGRHSPGYRGGAFSPVMDQPTHHFHRWVARKYRAAYDSARESEKTISV